MEDSKQEIKCTNCLQQCELEQSKFLFGIGPYCLSCFYTLSDEYNREVGQ